MQHNKMMLSTRLLGFAARHSVKSQHVLARGLFSTSVSSSNSGLRLRPIVARTNLLSNKNETETQEGIMINGGLSRYLSLQIASSIALGPASIVNTSLNQGELHMDSVLRKRRKKMNKHKLQKRRKLERRAHKR